MRHRLASFPCLIFCLVLTTGCWDRVELSDRAFDLAASTDLMEDGSYLTGGQFIIPSRISGGAANGGQPYFIETGNGKSLLEAIQKTRQKLSRNITRSHRRNYYIGESMAKHGINELLDGFSRDPGNRIRLDIWVVKGGQGMDALKVHYPLEKIPSVAPVKIHRAIGGTTATSYLDFMMASSSEGSSPTLPVVDIVQGDSPQKTIRFYGRAIFNHDYKLVGYLNFVEGAYRQWMLQRISYLDLAEELPEAGGKVGVIVNQFGCKIKSRITGTNKVKMEIELTGSGYVAENNTKLNLISNKNLKLVQKEINKKTSEHVLAMITKVQKEYRADVLGFNQVMNRQHPGEWKRLKGQWDTVFPEIEVAVHVNLNLKYVGLVRQPLQYKESEIIK
ncbi:Ger(x)C family spore germination protein [Paenibacillus glycanilyticus]|uniref:Ger(x)C family spore germination protein n=1 Tax=Paenibacillus glycanilyticus TaxID=126569 RepID=UPI00203C756E|nr:Ger(x)C family spore germination protein [Paenibacillus glycanilyticus]MCM3626080.1 Ger(x)C family spore germination protein [Paenibacillus glycanilyticus]